MQKSILCPFCQGDEMIHKKQNDTYIFMCDDCPIVMFEYSNQKNIDDLNNYLNGKK